MSLVYYGLSLGVSLLGGDLFLTSFISAVIELPSDLIVALILDKTGRRWPTVITFMASGVSCLICMGFVGNDSMLILSCIIIV